MRSGARDRESNGREQQSKSEGEEVKKDPRVACSGRAERQRTASFLAGRSCSHDSGGPNLDV